MNRRGFIQTSSAAFTAVVLSRRSGAQAPGAQQQSTPPETPLVPTRKLKVDAYSRHLQWLRSADEVAEATIEMAFTGVDLTVRPYPGHVDPTKVATDLPPFVNTLRKHGLEVSMITCPITDAESPNAEQILQTASSLGIKHYWWGTFRYEQGKPVMQQLDALKPRVEKLVKLNEKYKMKALYHTYSMPGTVGCNVWDFLYVLRNFDPAYVGFHWDVGHTSLTGGNGTWAESLRASAPYIGGLSVKEYTYELNTRGSGGPGGGTGGRQGSAGGPGGNRPATPVNPNQPDRPQGQAGAPSQQAAADAGGGRGPGGPGGAGGPGGDPGGRAAVPNGQGGAGQPLPWRARAVPLGEGLNNLPLLATILKEIQFDGPVEIQSEYPNGGAENAQDKITLPREMVLGAMKRDRLTLVAGFAASGLL